MTILLPFQLKLHFVLLQSHFVSMFPPFLCLFVQSDGIYIANMTNPSDGRWTAFFVQVHGAKKNYANFGPLAGKEKSVWCEDIHRAWDSPPDFYAFLLSV